MINRAKRRVVIGFGAKSNVINILARLEIARVVTRIERLIRTFAFEHDDGVRHVRSEFEALKQPRENVAELLQFGHHAARVLFAAVADNVEILGARAEPNIFGGNQIRAKDDHAA